MGRTRPTKAQMGRGRSAPKGTTLSALVASPLSTHIDWTPLIAFQWLCTARLRWLPGTCLWVQSVFSSCWPCCWSWQEQPCQQAPREPRAW